jgi:trehalose/maltose transport system substrate-binding protein
MKCVAVLCLFVSALVFSACRQSDGEELVISCGAVGIELELCQQGVEAWSAQTGQAARVVTAAAGSGERLSNMQLLLAAHSSDIDVFIVDTPWPGIVGDFFLDLRPSITGEDVADFFPSFIENNTVKGRLVALPWFIDGGLLYYRTDLLQKHKKPVPETWKDLTETALFIQEKERAEGNSALWGFVFQGRAYEGLTVNALEWIASWGGGTILGEGWRVTVNNLQALQALELASTWPGRIAPPGVLNYMEEEARGVFQSGNAVFMRNWPYAWKLAQAPNSPVHGKVGITVLPRGSGPNARTAAALGGWSLGVSKFSKRPQAAIELVKYLTSRPEQKRRALKGGLSPTRRSLYVDRDLLNADPTLERLYLVFQSAVPRPSRIAGTEYNRVSREFYEAVHSVLSTDQTRQVLGQLQITLERIGQRKRNGQ